MIRIIFWTSVVLVLIFLWLRYFERSNIFFPSKDTAAHPGMIGLPYEEVFFTARDGVKLNGWFVGQEGAADTILFFHGNAGNITHRLDKLRMFRELGLNIFIFDWRGYGKSRGSPSEKGFYLDGEAALQYLTEKKNIAPGNIIAYGESIGSAVAVDLATRTDFKALITDGAFTSVDEVAKMVYPFIPSFLISFKFDSLSKIGDVKCPVLVVHSVDDEIIPFRMGEELYNSAKPPKKFLKLRGGHNEAFLDSEQAFKDGIRSFLAEVQSSHAK